MPITINPKTITLINGTANDATKVEQIQTDLFENDETLKTAINDLVAGTDAFDLVKTDYISEETGASGVYVDSMRAKDGYVNLAPVRAEVGSVNTVSDTITTTASHNITTGTPGRIRSLLGATIPGGTSESTLYYFRAPTSNTLTLHTTAADAGTGASPVNLTSTGTTGAARQIIADPLNFKEADFWINQYPYVRLNGTTQRLLTANDALLTGYIYGKAPSWTSSASITIPAGLTLRDSTSVEDIAFTGDQVVSLAVSGAGGLDTGAEASNTWYYLYAIKNQSTGTVSAVFSVTNESVSGTITLPSGYTLKRQLPFAVRNNGSSNIIPFRVAGGWPNMPIVMYDTELSQTEASNATNILNAGTSGVFASVSAASFIPPVSTEAILYVEKVTSGSVFLKATGSSLTYGLEIALVDNRTASNASVKTNTSQSIDYLVSAGSVSLTVQGFIINQF